jgi:hypothetical protein
MSLASDPADSTELVAFIPEVWTPVVNEAFFDDTVLANFVTDLSPYAGEGDIFHVPDVFTNIQTAQTQSTQTTEVTTAQPASVDTTLTVNTHKYVAIFMGDFDLKLVATKYNVNDVYARQAAKVLATALEASIAALWSSITTNAIGDTATVLSDAEIRQGINALDSNNYDLSECAFFVHPYIYWNQLHAIAKYYTQATFNVQSPGPVYSGNFGSSTANKNLKGQLYGIPLYTSTNIVSGLLTYRNLLLHKSAFGFAVKTNGANRVRVQSSNLVQNLAMLTVVDIMYGVAVLREPGAVLLNGSNTFIGS